MNFVQKRLKNLNFTLSKTFFAEDLFPFEFVCIWNIFFQQRIYNKNESDVDRIYLFTFFASIFYIENSLSNLACISFAFCMIKTSVVNEMSHSPTTLHGSICCSATSLISSSLGLIHFPSWSLLCLTKWSTLIVFSRLFSSKKIQCTSLFGYQPMFHWTALQVVGNCILKLCVVECPFWMVIISSWLWKSMFVLISSWENSIRLLLISSTERLFTLYTAGRSWLSLAWNTLLYWISWRKIFLRLSSSYLPRSLL